MQGWATGLPEALGGQSNEQRRRHPALSSSPAAQGPLTCTGWNRAAVQRHACLVRGTVLPMREQRLSSSRQNYRWEGRETGEGAEGGEGRGGEGEQLSRAN